MSRDISLEICLKSTVLTDTGENVQKYFRLGAESYSSLGRVGKKKKITCPLLDVFACWQVSSPVSVNGTECEKRNNAIAYSTACGDRRNFQL